MGDAEREGKVNRPGRSGRSVLSLWSHGSVLSIASEGSVLSIGSIGSAASIGSIGSAASAFSIGSWLSIGSALSSGSLWSVMSADSRGSVMSWRSSGGHMDAYECRSRRGKGGPGERSGQRLVGGFVALGTVGLLCAAARFGRGRCRSVG